MNRDTVVEEHFKKYYKIVVKRAIQRVPDKSEALAEEVVQEAYAKALKFWKAYNPERSEFVTWYNRILNGCIADCIRNEGNGPPSLDNEDDNLEPYILDDNAWIPHAIVVQIKEGIKQQKPDVSEVLNMFFILGMKTIDIAECTNLGHANVRKMIQRFRIDWNDENIF